MSDLITPVVRVRYVEEFVSTGMSFNPTYYDTNLKIAQRYWQTWSDCYPWSVREIQTITVNDETFTLDQIREARNG